ncbi:hypothetical protein CAEBREN_20816 [Caenorhabditis brenneri]|uniref:RNase H type-1 domain-containing protein n=1 Tax=Caenorhabditis brenneri TaxID=135651 RepID=G0MZ41_CAEBE|nr:hypothetical protein CAEBREN_20816 [Caenorhabditis brenneri]
MPRRPSSLVIFTDGAALRNGQRDAKGGWAFVYRMNGSRVEIKGFIPFGKQSNNLSEFQGILEAIKHAYGERIYNITIRTDSQYAINCLLKWYWNWRKNGWKTSYGTDVKNREIIETIRSWMTAIDDRGGYVRLEHVPGHGTNVLNNLADSLANQAALENPIYDYSKYPKFRKMAKQLL